MFGSVLGRFAGAVTLACLLAGSAAAGADDPDMRFPGDWFAAADAAPAELTPEQAAGQANAVFDLVDRHIFDTALTAEARAKARTDALTSLQNGPLDQATVGSKIEEALQSIGYSHLHLFPPEIAREIADMTQGENDGKPAPSAISARMAADVGILRVDSFMVPLFTQKALAEAYAKLAGAKVLLIDLTGNGGGNYSPVVALAHPLIGAGKPVAKGVVRIGHTPSPFEQHGPLPDDNNHGGSADNGLGQAHGIVTWLTAKDAATPEKRPVYLLIDGHCGSSCEIFSGAIKHYAAARLLGRNTAGKVLGGIAYRPPMKGYMLLVPTSAVYGPGGELYEGPGVAPDIELPVCQTASDKTSEQARKACLDAALTYIKTPGAAR